MSGLSVVPRMEPIFNTQKAINNFREELGVNYKSLEVALMHFCAAPSKQNWHTFDEQGRAMIAHIEAFFLNVGKKKLSSKDTALILDLGNTLNEWVSTIKTVSDIFSQIVGNLEDISSNKNQINNSLPDLIKLAENSKRTLRDISFLFKNNVEDFSEKSKRKYLYRSKRCDKNIKQVDAMMSIEKELIRAKLIISERTNRSISEITSAEAKKILSLEFENKAQLAQEAGDQWLRELEAESKRPKTKVAAPKGKRKGRRKGKISPVDKKSVTLLQVSSSSASSSSSSSSEAQIDPQTLQTHFLQSLLHVDKHLHELPRVSERWKNATNEEIKEFVDVNTEGEIVKRYELLSPKERSKQRARHYLPGLERLLGNTTFKQIYTFPTSRGCGMFTKLNYGAFSEEGIVYIGIQQETIFHKYFESFIIANAQNNLLIDPRKEAEIETELDSQDGWIHTIEFDPSIERDGTIKLQFHNELHSLTIEPIRTDLLDPSTFLAIP